MHDGLHIFAAGLIGGIHVCNKAKPGRSFMARGGRQHAVHITVVVQQHILQAQRPHFLLEVFGQRKLALGAWVGVGLLAGSGVKFDILQKAFVCSHKMHPPDGVLLSVYHSLQHFSKASAVGLCLPHISVRPRFFHFFLEIYWFFVTFVIHFEYI